MNENNYLSSIVQRKMDEVECLLKMLSVDLTHPMHAILTQQKNSSGIFAAALKNKKLAVIAEIKRKSPSRGDLGKILDPVDLALQYGQGGASAISVLTDFLGFGGSLLDLQLVSVALSRLNPKIPTLRKDFIVHPIQIAEAAYAGADCVLLIAKILKDQLQNFISEATRLGLETLVEIHDEEDLRYALDAEAKIIGVNHRNLQTFAIDMSITEKLRSQIPSEIITVAESGILTEATAKMMQNRGYDAILVGEALVTANNPAQLIHKMRGYASES